MPPTQLSDGAVAGLKPFGGMLPSARSSTRRRDASECKSRDRTLSRRPQKFASLTTTHLPRGAWRKVRGNSDRAQLAEAVRLSSRRTNGAPRQAEQSPYSLCLRAQSLGPNRLGAHRSSPLAEELYLPPCARKAAASEKVTYSPYRGLVFFSNACLNFGQSFKTDSLKTGSLKTGPMGCAQCQRGRVCSRRGFSRAASICF
jgi:hypothetical protein